MLQTSSIPTVSQNLPASIQASNYVSVAPQSSIALIPQTLVQPISTVAQTLPANTQASNYVSVAPQSSIALIPQTVVQPIMQPVIPQGAQNAPPVVPQLVQSVIQPVQSVIPVMQPMLLTQPIVQQFIPPPPPPKPLTLNSFSKI